MPSATATLYLNLSAIKNLCRNGVLNGSGVPDSSTVGASGDFYIDLTTGYPNFYYLYGPKTTIWPVTSFPIPSQQFVVQSLSSGMTSMSSLSVSNNGQAVTIDATQLSATVDIARFNTVGKQTVVMIGHNGLGVFVDTNTNLVSTLDIRGSGYFSDDLRVDDNLSIGGDATIGKLQYTYIDSLSQPILTFNVPDSTTFNTLTAANNTFVLYNSASNGDRPIQFINSTFNVVSGTQVLFKVNYGNGYTITTNLSATTAQVGTVVDQNSLQLLTSRQTGVVKVNPATCTTTDLGNAFNTLIDKLTAHGLVSA